MKMIPFFVYGTLRKGFYNYDRILKGNVDKIVNATIDGYDMFSLGYYPGIVKGSNKIVGEVIYVKPSKYLQMVQCLDQLEGYNPKKKNYSLYLREIKKVTLENGEQIDAYVYIYNQKTNENHKLIENGDWASYQKENYHVN